MLTDWLSPCAAVPANAPINIDNWLAHRSQSLRPHQQSALQELRKRWGQGERHLLVALPTGAGKTRLAAEVTRFEVEAGRHVLWLVHRTDLVAQTMKSLAALQLPQDETVGIWQGGVRNPNPHGRVQIATIQSLSGSKSLPKADMLVIDECHHYVSSQWRAIIESYPGARRLMLSATPERADGIGMRNIAERIISPVQPGELIKSGSLVPCAVVGPSRSLGSSELAQDPCDAWMAWGGGRRAIVFCESKRHARDVAARFALRGVRAACIDEDTPRRERLNHYAKMRSGELTVITNVYVATEGLDIPEAEVCVVARNVSHSSSWRQMIGRVLRVSEKSGKKSALVLDLNGVSHRLGSPEEDRFHSLGDATPWSAGRTGEAAQPQQQNLAAEGVVRRKTMSVVGMPMDVLSGRAWFSKPENCEPSPPRSPEQTRTPSVSATSSRSELVTMNIASSLAHVGSRGRPIAQFCRPLCNLRSVRPCASGRPVGCWPQRVWW